MNMLRALLACVVAGVIFVACARSRTVQEAAAPPPPVEPTPQRMVFEATAYSVKGTTKSGDQARPGVVAADPRVLPIGTRIRVDDAGSYSGEYTVLDTGREIKGHEIDIFVPSQRAAIAFGRQRVQVQIIGASEHAERAGP
jgi:3D (Asp-Asp-Asp) domain-containing protein